MPPPSAIDVEAEFDPSAVLIPHRLTINGVLARRSKAGKLIAGVAAPSNVALFKGSGHEHKPKAKRWDHRLSLESASRKGNSIKNAVKYLSTPGLISIGGGLPSSENFPFDELSVKVPSVGHFSEQETHDLGVDITVGKHDLADGKALYDISTAFNYHQGTGSAQLLRWIVEHTEIVHNPPYSDWSCTMTVGTTSALDMALRMFTQRGDYILSEEYTFSSAVETAAPMGVKVLGIKMDDQGLIPSHMDELLSSWEPSAHNGARKPFVLYTVPSGQNPTGATQGAERRKEIFKVAQKHDLVILEDEPYYYLQMQPYTGQSSPSIPPPQSHTEFLASLVPSYLSMDVDGRVMRMDSFSKVIAPGSRVGWITAPEQLCERYSKHADVSTQGPSGMSQLILWKLLDDHWGHAGYLDWLIHIRMEYTSRRDVMLGACERHLPSEVASWRPPAAGMFHWIQINYRLHPSFRENPNRPVAELEEEIFMTIIRHGTLVMRGSWFYANSEEKHDTMFFRATYAAAPAGKIDEAVRRLGAALRESFQLEE